ncbi:MAG TPA: hypothetical protein ENK96_10510 [Desulfobulbaceae bacterium]|nr:hypothetical protein [Desulfobulbaceae bacterium]
MSSENQIIRDMGVLSDISYSSYDGEFIQNHFQNNIPLTANEDGSFSLSTPYTVIDYIDTPVTNMQALLLQKTGTDDYVIAFRGTQEFADKLVDATIGLANFNPQFSAAHDFVQDMMAAHDISADHLTLTGHSLGGILTQSVGAVMGIKGYAFNPYGTERLLTGWPNYSTSLASALLNVGLYKILDGLGLSSSYAAFAEENILNISYNDFGTLNGDPLSNLATALTSDHIGGYLAIFGENEGLSAHSMAVLNAALQQYHEILAHFTPETSFADLSTAYVYGGDDGFNRVNAIFDELGVADVAPGSLSFNFLFNSNSSELQSAGPAGMYALRELLPFTISGADYSHLNQNGELDADNYSANYLEDRAAFLYQVMHSDAASPTGDDMQFKDNALGIEAYGGNGTPDLSDRHYIFGTSGSDNFQGEDKEDHLYGIQGNEDLQNPIIVDCVLGGISPCFH